MPRRCQYVPPLRGRAPQGATNNKRLFTATGLITFKGRRDMEVLVMGEWSDWTVRAAALDWAVHAARPAWLQR